MINLKWDIKFTRTERVKRASSRTFSTDLLLRKKTVVVFYMWKTIKDTVLHEMSQTVDHFLIPVHRFACSSMMSQIIFCPFLMYLHAAKFAADNYLASYLLYIY